MIWTGHSMARTVGYVLLPIELMFWLGFSLPAGPPLGAARAILPALAGLMRPLATSIEAGKGAR